MGKVKDLTDQRFGKLTVIKRVESDEKGNAQWLCQCDCGNEKVARADNLKSGNTKSCGCIRPISNESKGCGRTRLYRIYGAMKSRCYSKNHK